MNWLLVNHTSSWQNIPGDSSPPPLSGDNCDIVNTEALAQLMPLAGEEAHHLSRLSHSLTSECQRLVFLSNLTEISV